MRITAFMLAFCVVGFCASAHEFWVQPSTLAPTPGSAFGIKLMHGERFEGHAVPRPNTFERFEIVSADHPAVPVPGLAGSARSYGKTAHRGSAIVVYESAWMRNELPADRFNEYLREERLGHVIRERASRGETDRPGVERYMRCAKAVLGSGGGGAGDVNDRIVGLPFEIQILDAREKRVVARVLLDGRPFEGARVVLASQSDPRTLQEARSDADGVVAFEAAQTGTTMLTSLWMRRIPQSQALEESVHQKQAPEWESLWASNVFRVGR